MANKDEKREKLARVAQLYYLEDWKQSDIAKEFDVSRPFVSRMLKQARELGVVEITIHSPEPTHGQLLELAKQRYGLQGGVLVAEDPDSNLINRALSEGAIGLLDTLKTRRLGVGWGHLMGEMVNYLESQDELSYRVLSVCPLLGNAGVPVRHYQSSETVRVFAQTLKATPHFLNLPALPGDVAEHDLLCGTESYLQIARQWERMDTVFVNIGNYPSTPDFASGARYGMLLQQKKACGRLLAYYCNARGEILQSEQDFALQIPLETLRQCKNVVGIVSANTSAKALSAALNTGLFSHLVAREALLKEALK
ncbi:sugar-binding domain-containing protein [Bengtsoniella intestinalis]|uniref:sugar-binding transcriptional regulator n=1 Tax=Bengtsoniella intestinalis TaxID=3073143 RepID=UPI00391F9E74